MEVWLRGGDSAGKLDATATSLLNGPEHDPDWLQSTGAERG